MSKRSPWRQKQVGLYEVLSLAAVLAFTGSSSARAEEGRSSLGARLRSTLSFDVSGGGATSLLPGDTDPGRGTLQLALHARLPLMVRPGLQLDYTAGVVPVELAFGTRVSGARLPDGTQRSGDRLRCRCGRVRFRRPPGKKRPMAAVRQRGRRSAALRRARAQPTRHPLQLQRGYRRGSGIPGRAGPPGRSGRRATPPVERRPRERQPELQRFRHNGECREMVSTRVAARAFMTGKLRYSPYPRGVRSGELKRPNVLEYELKRQALYH